MKRHTAALIIVASFALGACSATDFDRVKRDIAQAQEVVAAVNSAAQQLPQCAVVRGDAGTD